MAKLKDFMITTKLFLLWFIHNETGDVGNNYCKCHIHVVKQGF